MGLNAFFAFTVVLTEKYTWQQALAGVFCSSVIFLLISIFPIREYIINSIPKNLKLAISAGVGLFLGIIALEEAKIVVANQATLVTLGDLKQPAALLCILGFVTRCRSPIRSRPASAWASSPTRWRRSSPASSPT
jgi:adenine/guanine/hypoxanthine permease